MASFRLDKLFLTSASVVLALLLASNLSVADLVIPSGGSPQSGTLDFDLNLQTSVQLTVKDATNTATGNQTTIVGGQVNFGNINTISCTPAANKGDCFRLTANNGATLVGRFDLEPLASGFPNGVTVEVHRTDAMSAPGNPPAGRVYFTTANGGNNGAAYWGNPDGSGATVVNGTKVALYNGASGVTTGFQIGVRIMDSDAPGAKNAEITFTVTGNP